jgi:hypothetical protein
VIFRDVPGYTHRNRDGDLIGFKDPITSRIFFGETAERDQFFFTRDLMERLAQTGRETIAELRNLYRASSR